MVSDLSVSAVIVTYQHARYIVEAIESALAQPEVDEVLVFDDGSRDDTATCAASVQDSRVRIIVAPHRGLGSLAATYTEAYRATSGDLIAILEGDDKWPPGKLAQQRHHFSDGSVVVSHGPYAVMGAQGTVLRARVEPPHALVDGPYDALPLHLVSSYVMAVTALIRRSALDLIGGFSQLAGTPHWDYPTFLRLSETGRFAYTSAVTGIWRKHGQSGTMSIAGRDLEGASLARAEAAHALDRHLTRRDLPPIDVINRAWSEAAASNAFYVARALSAQGRRGEALRVAISGYRHARSMGSRVRLMGLAVAVRLGIDPEVVARRGGASPLEDLS